MRIVPFNLAHLNPAYSALATERTVEALEHSKEK